MSKESQPWFGAARRLGKRGEGCYGLAVDEDGVTLGPEFPLVHKTSRGYETATVEELSRLREVALLGVRETEHLTRHLESIAKALNAGDLARAQILGLYFPINRLTPEQVDRCRKASALFKQNFNPDEPRDERGQWTGGAASAASSSAASRAKTGGGTRTRRPAESGPVPMRVQEIVPLEPEVLPDPLIEEEPFPPYGMSPRPVTLERCLDAAERSDVNPAHWESLCRDVPDGWKRACWRLSEESVQQKKGFCADLFET